MSSQSGRRVLVLGGIRSGKSELAEALVAGAGTVRYVATADVPVPGEDPQWDARIAAHRMRRPLEWATEEIGAEPARLAGLLASAGAEETLLVDDLGGWLAAAFTPSGDDRWQGQQIEELAGAVRDCPARLVLVSPEVGLSVVPATEAGRTFADRLGTLNQAVAAACDAVVLVVAGQPTWLKIQAPAVAAHEISPPAPPSAAAVARPATTAQPPAPPAGESPISTGMSLPIPDETAAEAAAERVRLLDFPGLGLGTLGEVVRFAAGTQGRDVPLPWRAVRVLLLHADHDGGVSAGDSPAESARRLAQARSGEGALALLSGIDGITVESVRCAQRAAPIETGDAIDAAGVEAALTYGWQLAGSMADTGTDLLVLGSCGAGADAAAVALITMIAGREASELLGRVPAPGGRIDDEAWMVRCAALRDAVHRVRNRSREPRELLAMLGGPDLAVATGALIGAVARRTPVVIDGPVGMAAALVARDIGTQTRHWLLLPDHGGHPGVRHAAEVLGVTPLLDLKIGLGEGAAALAALPLLRSALTLAATVAGHPALVTPPVILDSPTRELPLVIPRG
jgi:nicotinate-nucleotide--dimethylbenzimidazole phosphoribosyltransferase